MPSHAFSRLLLSALLLPLISPPLRAEPIRWDYTTFVFPSYVTPDVNPPPPVTGWPGSIGVNFSGTSGSMANTAQINFANLWTSGWLPSGKQSTFKKQPVQIGMGILDRLSNRSQMTFFTAYLEGTLSTTNANLRLSFAERSKTLHIGTTLYRVNLGDVYMPGAPSGGPIGTSGSVRPWPGGSIAATVNVTKNPEPSTLLLLGVGGSIAGLAYIRRKKRTAEA